MAGETIQIHGRADSDFDCYLTLPQADGPVPAVVLASAVHGVDKDLRDLADEFASYGFIAAAPDLFWRTIPGSLTRADGELTTTRYHAFATAAGENQNRRGRHGRHARRIT
jgi:carboxymethylenebutenolidase